MQIGFILTKSPSEQGFQTFMDFAQLHVSNDNISLYLVGNGVYSASKNSQNPDIEGIFKNSKVYVNGNDLKARGIEGQIKDGINVFEQYDHLVRDVMENFDQVISF